jgi:hypothetical protein
MNTPALGYCGLNCEECPVFIATADDSRFLGKELQPEDMHCTGCRSEVSLFIGCANCLIRNCSREKKFATCAECRKDETCETLNGFFSYHHQMAKENLDRIREGR